MSCVLYACANTSSLVRIHPESLKGITLCSECHSDQIGAMNHQAVDFFRKHGLYAGNSRQVCSACHQESYCADCHAKKEEIKPSAKFADSPERFLLHRGDYLSKHKIDGRANPASCVKCHGRQNNERCASCHK
ncbi:MAG: cytochrome C [Deltaproteobacteria bacterium]|nr:cytochrome C [Deltaproteobacteria bacterium]